jgi:hypothetical protein
MEPWGLFFENIANSRSQLVFFPQMLGYNEVDKEIYPRE